MHIQGSKASEVILEGFADKLADIIVKGQSSIGDWSSERDAKINVSFLIASTRRAGELILISNHGVFLGS